MPDDEFDFSRPHPGSGLLFGEPSLHALEDDLEARAALVHHCSVCFEPNACYGYGRYWACDSSDCRQDASEAHEVDQARSSSL